ncbi:uncharacterized protein LOC143919358 [Arctopsyche grandis]|uniref:uncharacterized protein LOC143919358 n=1 Tax=Arctopsyche grandis TaxID=121162 RepID=UPI00406D710C
MPAPAPAPSPSPPPADPKDPARPKEKRKNNEKRKEKSRDAARCRRSKETEIFTELAGALPMSSEDVDQLDKASIMRLAISYLKVRSVMVNFPGKPLEIKSDAESCVDNKAISKDLSYLKALDGFVFVVSSDGDLIYLSENVSEYLGVTQMDIMGQSLFEFSHPCDHEEIRDVLSFKSHDKTNQGQKKKGLSEASKSFFIRLKCTLTSKGRNVNIKSASYKVIHCVGHLLTDDAINSIETNNNTISKDDSKDCVKTEKSCDESKETDAGKENKPKKTGSLIAIGRPIPHPSNIEIPLDSKTFLSKHNLDMKFTYVDEKMLDILGYEPEDLNGKSVYDYHHSMDSRTLSHDFKCLFSKGQCETGGYRFLAKCGGYAWLLTQATLVLDKQNKPVSVVCVNYVISGVECKDEILSCSQASAVAEQQQQRQQIPEIQEVKLQGPPASAITPPAAPPHPRPQPATAKIFAPRTEEMNKGFLMFSEEEPGLTMLKEEPEDLTHLAPVAGDVCIPLEDNPFDVFDEFILGDNYCNLLPEEFDSLGPDAGDTFAFYRSDVDLSPLSDISQSPIMLSPAISKGSDSDSMPSLSSPNSSLPEEELTTGPLLTELGLDSEMSSRAPFIPMGPTEDLPLLGPGDGRVMWGALPDHLTLHKKLIAPRPPTTVHQEPPSSLAKLLGATTPSTDSVSQNKNEIKRINDINSAWKGEIPTVVECERGSKRSASPASVGGHKRARARRPATSAPPPPPASSVLMNLLVSGCDMNSELNMDINFPKEEKGVFDGFSKAQLAKPPDRYCQRFPTNATSLSYSDKKNVYVSPYTNVLQNGSDPLLTVILSQNSSQNRNQYDSCLRKSPSLLLDNENSLFEEISPANWSMEEDLLVDSDLLGEFNTSI